MPKFGMCVDKFISSHLLLASSETTTASSTEASFTLSLVAGRYWESYTKSIKVQTSSLAETLNSTDGTIRSGTVDLPVDYAVGIWGVLGRMNMTRDMSVYMILEQLPPKFRFFLSYPTCQWTRPADERPTGRRPV